MSRFSCKKMIKDDMTLSVKNVTIYSQYFVEKNENIFLGE